ncbi:MAG: AraC family transcriptional regulator [Alphaproteobacteria bacterium]
MIAIPAGGGAEVAPRDDVLSSVLRSVRLSGSLQFCVLPGGAWHTDATPSLATMAGASGTIPFHVVAEGGCWLKMEGRDAVLAAGDVVAFPFGTGHQLGAGSGGRLVTPVRDLPPKPWREIPVLRYGPAPHGVRLLCGYLKCDAMSFRPLRAALPALVHVRTRGADASPWLRAAVEQMVAEVDRPRAGGASILERLSEIVFVELLRHQVVAARPGAAGWLAALADPALGRCLALIHDDPRRDWSVPALSSAAGVSRSTLAERFEAVLGTSPMRYLREWRLCLARIALATSGRAIAAIAAEAGYGTEAAFNRAFARAYGVPPASWRKAARRAQAA